MSTDQARESAPKRGAFRGLPAFGRVASALCLAALCVAVWVLGSAHMQTTHYGDDQEYLTMVSSFMRHGSPDFRPGDDTAMLAALPHKWQRSLGKKFHEGRPPYAYYQARDGKYFGWHFFTYPALVTPVRLLLDQRPDAFRAHQYTNLICFCLALSSLWLLRRSARLFWTLTALVFLTPVLWFLPYAHTETFVYSLGVVALSCYLSGRPLLAILSNSVAATQYQPLAVISIFLCLEWLWHRLRGRNWAQVRRSLPSLLAALSATAIIFIPGIFYFAYFGVPNLVVRESLASTRLLSLHKFGWMFIDPNGGMLAYTPGLLWLLMAASVWSVQRALRDRSAWGIALLGCVLLSMFASTCQRNWNHPTFGVSRYVLYAIAPFLLFIGNELRLLPAGRSAQFVAVTGVAIALQLFAHRVHGLFEYNGRDSAHHTDFAEYVLERWPALYSPPPIIFCARTLGKCLSEIATGEPLPDQLPVIWEDARGRAHKILAAGCDPAPVLRARAWSATDQAAIERRLRSCRGHGPVYIDL